MKIYITLFYAVLVNEKSIRKIQIQVLIKKKTLIANTYLQNITRMEKLWKIQVWGSYFIFIQLQSRR